METQIVTIAQSGVATLAKMKQKAKTAGMRNMQISQLEGLCICFIFIKEINATYDYKPRNLTISLINPHL